MIVARSGSTTRTVGNPTARPPLLLQVSRWAQLAPTQSQNTKSAKKNATGQDATADGIVDRTYIPGSITFWAVPPAPAGGKLTSCEQNPPELQLYLEGFPQTCSNNGVPSTKLGCNSSTITSPRARPETVSRPGVSWEAEGTTKCRLR